MAAVEDRKPFFKPPRVTERRRRARKREQRDARTRDNKQQVRDRDIKRTRRGCRFPVCGCWRRHWAIEVAHLKHQGMGGNPLEDRNSVDKMICVCNQRHKEHAFSLDKKTLLCTPLTDRGTNGPVMWEVDADALVHFGCALFTLQQLRAGKWLRIAIENPAGEVVELQPDVIEFLANTI